MAVTVASTDKRIAMIEAGANEVSDEIMFNGIMAGHEANQKIIEFIKGIQAEIGKAKFCLSHATSRIRKCSTAVMEFATEDVKAALDTDDKTVRDERLKPVYEKVHEHFDPIYPEQRGQDRRVHVQDRRSTWSAAGCWTSRSVWTAAAWTRCGLWPPKSACFPGYTVPVCSPAARPRCSPSRRLGSGHETSSCWTASTTKSSSAICTTTTSRPTRWARPGPPEARAAGRSATALWPRSALVPVIPPVEEFPYAIRLVSEVLSSNGSTSQGFHLRLHPGSDGRRRADQGAGSRYLLRPDHRGRALDDHGGYPGLRGFLRRYGL